MVWVEAQIAGVWHGKKDSRLRHCFYFWSLCIAMISPFGDLLPIHAKSKI